MEIPYPTLDSIRDPVFLTFHSLISTSGINFGIWVLYGIFVNGTPFKISLINVHFESRGFAFWYQDLDSYSGCRFRIRTKNKEYLQDIQSIPQTWFFVTFRWREGDEGTVTTSLLVLFGKGSKRTSCDSS